MQWAFVSGICLDVCILSICLELNGIVLLTLCVPRRAKHVYMVRGALPA
jgi:hypothetical protein